MMKIGVKLIISIHIKKTEIRLRKLGFQVLGDVSDIRKHNVLKIVAGSCIWKRSQVYPML